MEIEKRKKTVWNYYTRDGKNHAKCNECKKILKTAGGSTSGLHAHLKSRHGVNLLKRVESDASTSTSILVDQEEKSSKGNSSRNIITQYFKKNIDDSLSAIVSRMVARDGLPFQKFITSYDLRKLLTDKGYEVPKSANSIKQLVMQYGNKIRSEIRQNILEQIKKGFRFSLTFDEWTSNKNRRYININVHTAENKFWNLGLARAHGTMNANRFIEVVSTKLEEFGLNFESIVSITTDGAAVMKKLGLSLTSKTHHHQLCLVHAIHLAVIKILYKKNEIQSVSDECESNDEEFGNERQEEEDDDDEITEGINLEFDSVNQDVLNENISPIIRKIRSVVKLFRRSPTKNEVLQKHVINEFGKEISFILDNRTRWNSLLDMLERFNQLKSCARKSLIDLNIDISFSENEIDSISSVISTLLPVKLAVEALCVADCTLLNADITIKFMLDELSTQDTSLSRELKYELLSRIKERRTSYSDVMQFLHNPVAFKYLHQEETYNLFKFNRSEITKNIVALIQRLTSNILINDCQETVSEDEVSVIEPTVLSMKERLQLAINKQKSLKLNEVSNEFRTSTTSNLLKLIKQEITVLETEQRRGKYLTMAFNYISTIKPTSIESERAFSAAGIICTKIRTSLNDCTLDTICMLRAYFNEQNI